MTSLHQRLRKFYRISRDALSSPLNLPLVAARLVDDQSIISGVWVDVVFSTTKSWRWSSLQKQ